MCIANVDLAQSSPQCLLASLTGCIQGHTQTQHRKSQVALILDPCTKVGVKRDYE
jgi:hypothetical protein